MSRYSRIDFLILKLGLFVGFGATVARGADETAAELARYDARIKPSDRQHWAFQPVRTAAIPPGVKNSAWVRNPIDAFVLSRLEARGWQPAPAAEPRAILRRLYLNLTGLPPTLAEQEAFLKNPAPQVLDRIVKDLLARPTYGERWARHWLDLVRFAESNGYERDGAKPNVWRYRDYVIHAFNDDKPFDRFVVEQLAGDELPDASAETLVATGYFRLGPWDDEPADPKADRYDQLDDMIHTTTSAFLGLTLSCARCHNHKFDALTLHDYYRMMAIFNPLKRPQNGRTELDRPIGTRAELAESAEHEQKIEQLIKTAAGSRLSAIRTIVNGLRWPGALIEAPTTAAVWTESRKPIADCRQLEKQIDELKREMPDLPRGYFMYEPASTPPATNLLLRGSAGRPGPEVGPGMPTVLVSRQPSFPAKTDRTSQRRLTLAHWIASAENPLTARVIVNRVWQNHFGEGLVRTPSDFGVMGQLPTHPELLDWLADWFVREGWSLKKLHQFVLTSNTYRMSKRANPEYLAEDPENRLLWRVPYQRLEVEAIRDSMLAISGQLNPKMYGPSMYPEISKQVLEGHSDPAVVWKPSDDTEQARRTIYAFVKRSLLVPMIETLDFCDTVRSTAKRTITTVAPQALSLLIGDFTNQQAAHLSKRLVREAGGDPDKQIELAYRLVLCRPPTAFERNSLVEFLTHSAIAEVSRERAREQVCRVLFNLNEFVYPD